MSYSFQFKADTKAEAGFKIALELDNVVLAQPTHAADRDAAVDAARAFVAILKEPAEGECIGVSMTGSLSWRDADTFTGASVNISAYIAPKV